MSDAVNSPRRLVFLASFSTFLVVFFILSGDYYPPGFDDYVAVDSVDPGNIWSELLHYYWPKNVYNSPAVVLYNPDNTSFYDDFRTIYGGQIELFYVKGVPGQDLVMVKRHDEKSSFQNLSVYVWGRKVGVLHQEQTNGVYYAAESAFVIPGEYVDADVIQVKLVYPPGGPKRSNYYPSLHYFFYYRGSRLKSYLASFIKSLIAALSVYALLAFRKTILSKDRYLVPLLFIAFTAPSAAFSYYVLGGMPHTPDGITQLFQAKLLSEGKFYLTALSDPLGSKQSSLDWDFNFMRNLEIFVDMQNARIYGKYLILYPSLLAIGLLFDMPYLVNPILGGLSVVAFLYLSREVLNSRGLALCATLLMAFSPFYLLMSSSFMNNSLSLLACIMFCLAYLRSLRTEGFLNPFLSGLSLGMLLNIRLYNLLLFTLPFILMSLGDKRITLSKMVSLFAGFSILLVVFLGYNYLITGNVLTTPFQTYNASEQPGFGLDINVDAINTYSSPGHSPIKGFLNTRRSLGMLDDYLYASTGLLYFSAAIFLFFHRKDRMDWLLFLIVLSTVVGYFAYYYHCIFFGPRYYYELMPFIILLTVKSLGHLEISRKQHFYPLLVAFCAASSLMFLYSNVGVNATYHQIDTRLIRLFKELVEMQDEDCVIFVAKNNEYKVGFNLNDWSLGGKVLFLTGNPKYYKGFVENNFPTRKCYKFSIIDDEPFLTEC